MSIEATLDAVMTSLEALRSEIASLHHRIDLLEHGGGLSEAPAERVVEQQLPAVATAPVADEIPQDIVLSICAAVAAYLGERPHIRHIRLLSSTSWAQQGRVSIQASHKLH